MAAQGKASLDAHARSRRAVSRRTPILGACTSTTVRPPGPGGTAARDAGGRSGCRRCPYSRQRAARYPTAPPRGDGRRRRPGRAVSLARTSYRAVHRVDPEHSAAVRCQRGGQSARTAAEVDDRTAAVGQELLVRGIRAPGPIVDRKPDRVALLGVAVVGDQSARLAVQGVAEDLSDAAGPATGLDRDGGAGRGGHAEHAFLCFSSCTGPVRRCAACRRRSHRNRGAYLSCRLLRSRLPRLEPPAAGPGSHPRRDRRWRGGQ